MPERIETVKSGAVIFLISSSTITFFGNLPAFGGTILQAFETVLHFGNAAFKSCCQGFIRQCSPDNGGDDLVQIGKPLHRIGEGLCSSI